MGLAVTQTFPRAKEAKRGRRSAVHTRWNVSEHNHLLYIDARPIVEAHGDMLTFTVAGRTL